MGGTGGVGKSGLALLGRALLSNTLTTPGSFWPEMTGPQVPYRLSQLVNGDLQRVAD